MVYSRMEGIKKSSMFWLARSIEESFFRTRFIQLRRYSIAVLFVKNRYSSSIPATVLPRPRSWLLRYDRMLNRRIDNSKILDVTGYKQTDFISLKDGLARELSGLPEVLPWDGRDDLNKRMDDYLINFR